MTAFDEALLMAVPAHAVCIVRGLCLRPSIEVLDVVADDHWFALARAIDQDVAAAAVVGAVITCQRGTDGVMRVLVGTGGSFAQVVPFTVDNTASGEGLAACRQAVRAAVIARCGEGGVRGIELVGYAADTASLGRALALVYRADVREAGPEAGTWVPVGNLPLCPSALDALLIDALP